MKKDINPKVDGTTLYVPLGYDLSVGNAPALKDMLSQYRDQDIRKIVFDATDLVFISSSGIRVVIYASRELGDHPEIVFLNTAKEIYEAFEMVGVHTFISFEEDERKNDQTSQTVDDDEWQKKLNEAKQQQLDYFAAHNDVVAYQMKLVPEEE